MTRSSACLFCSANERPRDRDLCRQGAHRMASQGNQVRRYFRGDDATGACARSNNVVDPITATFVRPLVLKPRLPVLSKPHLAVRHSELIEEIRSQKRHCLLSFLAVPERTHVSFGIPQCDGIASVSVVLISHEPLVPQSLHITPQRDSLLVGCLELIPLTSSDAAPDDTHVHLTSPVPIASTSQALLPAGRARNVSLGDILCRRARRGP